MPIDRMLLESEGAIVKKYIKGEIIFLEGNEPRCYYQIISGEIKMFSINSDGKEFTQGTFSDTCCFGEVPLLLNQPYPASAMATEDTFILKLASESFHKLVKHNHEIALELLFTISKKTYNKAITLREVVNNPPEIRILSFLDSLKAKQENPEEQLLVPFTRQEIANYTGLRVETVIRTLLRMKKQKKVDIIDHKLYY
jgi:CRP-like cAMP-binding protein